MPEGETNSIAAVLSHVVRAIFWLAVIIGVFGFVLIGLGVLGSVNGGVVKVPGMETYVENVEPGRLVAALVGLVVFSVGISYVCAQLSRILSTLAAGDPFVPENGPRLTRIALAIAMIELVRNGAVFVLSAFVDLGVGYEPKLMFNLAAWGAVLTLFILAQVFREGSRLREEEKMTI